MNHLIKDFIEQLKKNIKIKNVGEKAFSNFLFYFTF